jgi:hypothetical protein
VLFGNAESWEAHKSKLIMAGRTPGSIQARRGSKTGNNFLHLNQAFNIVLISGSPGLVGFG